MCLTVSDWIQITIAVGTIGAVVVALFGDWLKHVLRPPRLELSFENKHGVKVPCTVTEPGGIQRQGVARWYHVNLRNKRRWSTAHGAQVYITKLEEQNAAGGYATVWVGEIPVTWRNPEIRPITASVGPEIEVDLCSVLEDKYLAIHPIIQPMALPSRWDKPCKIAVSLMARAIEADSKVLRVNISWDGAWDDDATAMRRHLVAD
jgi:hypothetical protein